VSLTLDVLEGRFGICRLDPSADVPRWAGAGAFVSVTRTGKELSIVCDLANVPAGVTCEAPWRALALRGPIPFTQTGVLASLTAPLAAAGISLFAVSTYDTDYVLVRDADLDAAAQALRQAGHQVG
jgi:hypothetical protein